MGFAELWESLCRKKPSLKDDTATVEFTVANLKKLLRQVHGQGESFGRDIGKAEGISEQRRKQENASSGPSGSFIDPFSDLFRGGL